MGDFKRNRLFNEEQPKPRVRGRENDTVEASAASRQRPTHVPKGRVGEYQNEPSKRAMSNVERFSAVDSNFAQAMSLLRQDDKPYRLVVGSMAYNVNTWKMLMNEDVDFPSEIDDVPVWRFALHYGNATVYVLDLARRIRAYFPLATYDEMIKYAWLIQMPYEKQLTRDGRQIETCDVFGTPYDVEVIRYLAKHFADRDTPVFPPFQLNPE